MSGFLTFIDEEDSKMNVEKIWLRPFKFLHKHIKPFCFKYSHENECGVVYIIYKSTVLDSGNMVKLIKGRFFALQIITYWIDIDEQNIYF